MPNVKTAIASHNNKILSKSIDTNAYHPTKECYCKKCLIVLLTESAYNQIEKYETMTQNCSFELGIVSRSSTTSEKANVGAY